MRTWKVPGAPSEEQQLARWVEGESLCPNENHECCPDFSCCKPKLQWPKEKRQGFAAASQAEREKMLMGSIVALASSIGEKAYVTRGNPMDHK